MRKEKGKEGGNLVTGQDIVNSAYKLLGAVYRQWYPGSLLPMWLADGQGDPPAAEYLVYGPGVMCADLVTWACYDNGIWAPAGTQAWGYDYLVNTSTFDPNTPGEPGAICLAPFGGGVGAEGHIAIYTGEHYLIQSLTSTGVTDQFTDYQTYVWPECNFEIYGYLPGVDYSGGQGNGTNATPPADVFSYIAINRKGTLIFNGEDWSKGWFDRNWNYRLPTDPGE